MKRSEGCTEIRDFGDVASAVNAVGLQQDVARLEVTMHNAEAVDVVHALCHLLGCPQQRSLSEDIQ